MSWRRKSPGWTTQLTDQLYLLEALDPPNRSPEELSPRSGTCSVTSSQVFRRRGHVTGTVWGMLELLSGSVDGPGVDRRVFCSGCGSFFLVDKLPPQNRPAVRSAGNSLTRSVQSLISPCVYICAVPAIEGSGCGLSPWILPGSGPKRILIAPVPTTVSFGQPGRHFVYGLFSVIYGGRRRIVEL